ncbi:hypothetical protein ACH5RR_026095 [Cinchona calisaya]|uniref:Aminotransferase-like plant mobile domain-containing protein n=1 Tax=Cinchona calisaya TaxID=153742 RepID=A0ABD2Z6J3_9GENT
MGDRKPILLEFSIDPRILAPAVVWLKVRGWMSSANHSLAHATIAASTPVAFLQHPRTPPSASAMDYQTTNLEHLMKQLRVGQYNEVPFLNLLAGQKKEHGAFADLRVDDVYREKTYLAALISCWIANSSQPGKGCLAFLVHYVHVWLAQYFNTHQPNPPRQPDSTMAKFSGSSSVISFDEISAREHIMQGNNFAWHSPSFTLEKNGPKTLTELFLSSVNDPASGSVPGSRVDAEAIAMDEGTSSQKRCVLQEVQDETSTDDHPNGHPSQQLQLDEVMSDETLLIQRSRCLKKKFVEETSLASEQKLKHFESIQAKRLSLEGRRVELVKELEQLEVEMQWADAEIHRVNDEISRDQHLMTHLATVQANLNNTPIVSSKDFEDFEALHIALVEE